jgi:ankyrin repeat protein
MPANWTSRSRFLAQQIERIELFSLFDFFFSQCLTANLTLHYIIFITALVPPLFSPHSALLLLSSNIPSFPSVAQYLVVTMSSKKDNKAFLKAVSSNRSSEVARMLADESLNANIKDIRGDDALKIASEKGHNKIISLLLASPRRC